MFSKKQLSHCGNWIDSVLSENDFIGIKSINFNLYEGEGTFHLQIIGSKKTPNEDEEWYCDNDFTTGENVFIINRSITGEEWKKGLEYFTKKIKQYIQNGKYKNKLTSMKAIGIGFVDGDIEIIYES